MLKNPSCRVNESLWWSCNLTLFAQGLWKAVYVMLLAAFSSFFCDLAPQLGCWAAARIMHIIMLRGILRAPLTFFDTTPTGRIIGRFAKDIDVVDTAMPQQISDSVYCLFEVMLTLCSIHFPPLSYFLHFSCIIMHSLK